MWTLTLGSIHTAEKQQMALLNYSYLADKKRTQASIMKTYLKVTTFAEHLRPKIWTPTITDNTKLGGFITDEQKDVWRNKLGEDWRDSSRTETQQGKSPKQQPTARTSPRNCVFISLKPERRTKSWVDDQQPSVLCGSGNGNGTGELYPAQAGSRL